jgi:hypothetical protein
MNNKPPIRADALRFAVAFALTATASGWPLVSL